MHKGKVRTDRIIYWFGESPDLPGSHGNGRKHSLQQEHYSGDGAKEANTAGLRDDRVTESHNFFLITIRYSIVIY